MKGIIKCSNCQCEIIRRGYDYLRTEDGQNHTPLIFTRTLVRGEFLPSCSLACAAVLRAQRDAIMPFRSRYAG